MEQKEKGCRAGVTSLTNHPRPHVYEVTLFRAGKLL